MGLIAYYFHWDRATIRALPSRERKDWAKFIIEHTNYMNGGSDEEDGK